MGVENNYDAYAATKHAIYALLYGTDINTRYRGIGTRGQNIINAINNIINMAINHTQAQRTASLTLVKSNEFGQDEKNKDYYSQTYRISSDIDMKTYTITGIDKLPTGSYISDTNGNIKSTFSANEEFKIMIPKKEANKIENITGIISVQAKCKNYPVFYGSKNSSLQPYAMTFDSYGDNNNGQLTVNYVMNTGTIRVNKIDAETSKPIEGVTFELKREDGTIVSSATTGPDGIVTFSHLLPGNYTIKETTTNKDYILNEETFDITVEYNETITKDITNEHKRGNLKVYKVDADNNKIVLGGVKFALYSYEFEKITGYYTTDANGEIYIEGLRTGQWALIEQETNKWYNLTDQVEIKVEWNETTDTTIENELKKSQIKIIKVDQENHEIKLKDIEFEILDKEGNVLEKIKTDENGEAITSRYAVRDYPYLYVKEIKTNDNYVLDDSIKEVKLEENKIIEKVLENKKIRGKIKIIKTAKEDNKITKDKKGTPIPNVSFGIYDENKKYIETIVTGEDGTATSSLLEKGVKYVKELKSGEWYLLDENEYMVEIVKDGDIIELNITNTPEDPDVDIEKDGTTQATVNQEIRYEFKIKNTGNVPLNNFTWYDYLPSDYIKIKKLVTGTYNQNLNYNIYYKTNLKDYKLLAENLNTQINNYIDFSNIELEEGEVITEFKADFGTVDVGFQSIETPCVFATVNDTVKKDDMFTNKTRIEGDNKGYLVWDEDEHTIRIYEKEKQIKKLPRTGF